MFFTQPVTLIAYLIIAFLVGNVLAVCRKIDRTKYDVVMDMPLVYVGSKHIFITPVMGLLITVLIGTVFFVLSVGKFNQADFSTVKVSKMAHGGGGAPR